jgi:uracil-DNA glycosylase family 4
MLNPTQLRYLTAMDIQPWGANEAPQARIARAPDIACWETLRASVASCTACGLEKTRTQTVFGVGNLNAKLMIIGEAPGFNEDKQGEPFVGRAGQLLDSMLEAIGFDRNSVYIANILKCRPPENRDPRVEEVNLCTPFLAKQIALLNPTLLLAVGRVAAHFLLNTKTPLGQLRSKVHTYGPLNSPLIITYHPAYLLRNPREKNKAYEDLQMAWRNLQNR